MLFSIGFHSYGARPPRCYGEHYGGPSFHQQDVPPYVFPRNGVQLAPDLSLHAMASVASSLGDTVALLGSLLYTTMPPPLASNILMLLSTVSGYDHPQHFGRPSIFDGVPLAPGGNPGGVTMVSGGIPPAIPLPPAALHFPPVVPAAPMIIPAVVPVVIPAVAPAVVPTAPAMVPAVIPASPVPMAPFLAPPVASVGVRAKQLKLNPMKDVKAFLDLLEQKHFYLRMPEFSTGHANCSLIIDAKNLEASRAWEGQLRLAIKEGSLRSLFENKGSLFHGRGFEMLDTLMQHCHPDTVSNAFTSLLSLSSTMSSAIRVHHRVSLPLRRPYS